MTLQNMGMLNNAEGQVSMWLDMGGTKGGGRGQGVVR